MMAMNKAEAAALEALKVECAFHWPTEVEPKPVDREWIEQNKVTVKPRDQSIYKTRMVALGWWFNTSSRRVEPAWSEGHTHGRGCHTGDFGTQGMGVLYRTEREAYIAMRWAVCREFAQTLRSIDVAVETLPPTPFSRGEG